MLEMGSDYVVLLIFSWHPNGSGGGSGPSLPSVRCHVPTAKGFMFFHLNPNQSLGSKNFSRSTVPTMLRRSSPSSIELIAFFDGSHTICPTVQQDGTPTLAALVRA